MTTESPISLCEALLAECPHSTAQIVRPRSGEIVKACHHQPDGRVVLAYQQVFGSGRSRGLRFVTVGRDVTGKLVVESVVNVPNPEPEVSRKGYASRGLPSVERRS